MTPPDSVGKVVAAPLHVELEIEAKLGHAGRTSERLMRMAADAEAMHNELARLQALDRQRQEEVSELAADRDSWRDQASDRLKEWDAMRLRAEAAEAALAEARELLQQVETFTAYANCDTCCEMNALARAFLTRTAKEPNNA